MGKRGQAATEFIMTYGWAVMIVLMAFGALTYSGVLDRLNSAPKICVIEPGFACPFSKIEPDKVILVVKNAKQEDINVTSVTVQHCTGSASGVMTPEQQVNFAVGGCGNTVNKNFKADIYFTYYGKSQLVHTSKGKIQGVVEPKYNG